MGTLVDLGIVPGVWFILLNGAGLIVPAAGVGSNGCFKSEWKERDGVGMVGKDGSFS